MQHEVSTFLRVKVEMSIHAPKIIFFEDLTPKWGAVWMRPQKARPCAETLRMMYRSSKSDHWCEFCAYTANFLKGILTNLAGDVYAQTTHVVAAPQGEHKSGHNHDVVMFQVSSKSVHQGFRSPRWSKFALSHYLGYWHLPYQLLQAVRDVCEQRCGPCSVSSTWTAMVSLLSRKCSKFLSPWDFYRRQLPSTTFSDKSTSTVCSVVLAPSLYNGSINNIDVKTWNRRSIAEGLRCHAKNKTKC